MLDGLKALAALGLIGVAASKSAQKKKQEQKHNEYRASHKNVKYVCPGCGRRYTRSIPKNDSQFIHYCGTCHRNFLISRFIEP